MFPFSERAIYCLSSLSVELLMGQSLFIHGCATVLEHDQNRIRITGGSDYVEKCREEKW